MKKEKLQGTRPPDSTAYFEARLPEHYRRWIRAGILMGAVGYFLVGFSTSAGLLRSTELKVSLVCVLALFAERRYPRLAAHGVLLMIWAELMWSILHSTMRASSSMVLPVWIIAVAMFVGKRTAWIMAAITAAIVPLFFIYENRASPLAFREAHDVNYLMVLMVSVIAAALLITSFLSTLSSAVKRERESAKRAALLVEESPDGMIAVSAGRIVAFNEMAERYFSITRREVLGKEFAKLSIWNGPPPSLHGQRVEASSEQVLLGKKTIEVRVQHLSGEDERPEQLLVLRDVSERAAAEAKTQELQVQLEHAQRLEAIGQLAGGIAHDFNNLLTAFVGSAELLLDSEDARTRELAEGIASASDRGAALTRQLLTFARRETVQARPLDLSKVVEEAQPLLSHLLGERIALDLDLEPDCWIKTDKGQLEQIILNLAANARDAITGPGTLSITTRFLSNRVQLRTSDNGAGMDEETRSKIFEPFFTTKPREKGTGLGLSTVHGIVKQSKGNISVESEIGRGTTFSIDWPPTEPQADPHKKKRRSSSSRHPMEPAQVLFVEDDDAARKITQRLMSRSGLTVTTATSAEEALALCRDGLTPDILVSDAIMRGMTGVDLAERLRKDRPDLPVLFISGYVDDVLRDWPFDSTNDLLLKPFATDEFLERIDEKLTQSREKKSMKENRSSGKKTTE